MSKINISPWLTEKIQNGEVILFLGAGASLGATKPDGNPPTGLELRDILSDKFLGGAKKDWPLNRVADYAKTQSSLVEVQNTIKENFENLKPANFHKLTPKFRWFAIFTTNYDLVLESAYDHTPSRLQKLAPIISDYDDFSKKISDPSLVPYLKLHGCITRINDPNLPLILASEEYAKYEKNRIRLFNHLKEWGREYPIIFCGYDVSDPNIQHILFALDDLGISRPKYALVKPSIDELDKSVWMARRFEVIKSDFEGFLIHLNNTIPEKNRTLSSLLKTDRPPISKKFTTTLTPTSELLLYLEDELQYIHKDMPVKGINPKDFYQGLNVEWGIFQQELDVRRRITDDLLLDCILDEKNTKNVQCCLLMGHAGSGKNVTLRRTAWEAATEYEKTVFYLKEGGLIRNHLILELFNLVKSRINIFIDNSIFCLTEILGLIHYANKNNIRITLLFGARTNEWNIYGEELAPLLNYEYELRDLSQKEIICLLEKLEQHNCLGHLSELTLDQRKALFKFDAERQLLVALHEATSGKSFEELVYDEYQNIIPSEAKLLYLDICSLFRLNAPVRAGLISRISGITFDKFQKELLKPLEHVVRIYKDKISRDYVYRSRHPLIAKFVFEQALPKPNERQNQIIRMLKYMNVDFKWDKEAFSYLIKGRELAVLFSNRILADQIYNVASETGADLAHIYHQKAIFELNHPSGSASKALGIIQEAESLDKRHLQTLLHTKGLILRKLATESRSDLEKNKYRKDAKNIFRKQLLASVTSHPYYSLVQVLLDEIKDKNDELRKLRETDNDSTLTERVLTDLISQAEDTLSSGIQKFPEDAFLLTVQADLSELLKDEPTVIKALESAFRTNPNSDIVASRLAKQYIKKNDTEGAIKILNRSLEYNTGSKLIHSLLAKTYSLIGEEANKETISHHLKRSFTEGDTNYESQILYARHEFLYGDRAESKRIFNILKNHRFPPQFRNRYWGEVKDSNGKLIKYTGFITALHDNFCFVYVSTLGESIFIHYSQFSSSIWEQLTKNTNAEFNIAFTVRGPNGIKANINK
ncbi:hypothetical protein BMS3Bbin08_00688 [bacterium BMS3Bbin08]|nr:hypothetical protein BMS3Bbin08_00688 [bacterium BMS3Bbin08]